ncbi:hypothetical protein GCM10019017_21250 [Streptomyces showdoensis]
MHPSTADSLRVALFTSGAYELTPPSTSGDVNRPWEDPHTCDSEPEMEPAEGWSWHHADRVVEGISWGGNLEIISWKTSNCPSGRGAMVASPGPWGGLMPSPRARVTLPHR